MALWCQPTPLACQPASPAGVQSPTPLALSSALPYIRQTLGLLPCPPNTAALLVSSAALHWAECMGGVCHCVIARLQAGVRPARLPQSFRGLEFSSCGAQNRVLRKCRVSPPLSLPQLTSGAPDAPLNFWEMGCVCDEILETGAVLGIASPCQRL